MNTGNAKKPTRSRVSARKKDESDKPNPWPTHGNAKEARDLSAEEAQRTLMVLRKMRDRTNDAEVLRMIAQAIDSQQNILRLMERQGAPTVVVSE